MTKILTSLEREFELPFKAIKLRNDEQVVATNALMGMLVVEQSEDGEILKEFNPSITEGIHPICLPTFEDFRKGKEIRKKAILSAISKQ